MSTVLWSLHVLLFCVMTGAEAYNILFMMPFGSKSHKTIFRTTAEQLARRGHKSTIVSAEKESTSDDAITEVYLASTSSIMAERNTTFFHGTPTSPHTAIQIVKLLEKIANATYRDPFVADIVKRPRDPHNNNAPRFDVVVVDTIFNEFTLPLVHHMGVPAIYFAPTGIFPSQAWSLNIPHPLAYIPSMMLPLTRQMTFLQRTQNLAVHVVFHLVRNYYIFPHYDDLVRHYLPNTPPVLNLENNVSFLLSNTHPSVSAPMPLMPYFVQVGGIHCKPAKALPQELDDFMQSSGKAGVIFFSLGSVTKGEAMPLEMRDQVMEAFAQLPQKILWKYETDIKNLPSNIRLTKWAPQQDLLGHPKIKLFITHGGALSTQEAIYHGCPFLGFPLSADQWGNMANARDIGVADFLDWRAFTSEEFLMKIRTLTTDKKYKENVLHLSALIKDRLVPPAVEAAYWIEYVVRNRGAPHLKSGAEHLNVLQYFLLDIFAVLFLFLSLLLATLIILVRCVCKCFRRKTEVSNVKKSQ